MVIKGGARAEADKLAAHLLRVDTNERVDVRELLGVCAPDLTDALREMEAIASAARSRRPFYHASINTAPDELMTDAQKARAIDRLEEELGLSGQPRIVVEHVKEGREHLHIAWSRIDGETLCAIPDSHNYRRHEIVARDLEREFGHARVQGAHHERDGVERPARCPSHAETRQAERSGITPEEAKARLRELWQSADSGQAFAAALDHAGWILAEGDRRGFVALDPAGEVRAVNKDITGLTAAKLRERLCDIDPARLPSVDAARDQLRGRQREAEAQAAPQTIEQDEPGLNAAAAPEAAAREAAPEAAPGQDDTATLKSPEDMRREWAALMRGALAPEVVAEPVPAATPDIEPQPVPKQERAASPSPDRETPVSDPAADRKAWADRLRSFETQDPAAERKAWAQRLRQFADEKPAPAAERKAERSEVRTDTLKPEPAAETSKPSRPGLFERIRSFVRRWWEPKPEAEPVPDRAAEPRSDASHNTPDRTLTAARRTTSAPPESSAPTPSRPVEPVRRRSLSQEMLDEAQAYAEAERARETPAQCAEREKPSPDAARGRDHGDRARYHHSPLLDLPPPWQHRRVHSPRPHFQP